MTANSTGIAGAPSWMQIVDKTNPANIGAVDRDGNVSTLGHTTDQAGQARALRSAPDGSVQLASEAILAALLIEMRIQTKLLSAIAQGLIDKDDPDLDRRDADINHFLDSYNLM